MVNFSKTDQIHSSMGIAVEGRLSFLSFNSGAVHSERNIPKGRPSDVTAIVE